MQRADIDLRHLVGAEVLDQGTRPTCVPFAASAAHEAARTRNGAQAEHLSPDAIWSYCVCNGKASDDGMVLIDASPALIDDGQPLLTHWPYEVADVAKPEDLEAPPWHRANLTALSLAHDAEEARIEDALTAGQPVILIVEVTDEFLNPDEDGVIAIPDIRSGHGGYHAVTCVGAATHPVAGRHLLIKNSWGDEWGLGGYAWLPVGYLEGFAAEAAVIPTVIEEPSDD
jgi:C1A family cysteine protease